MSEHIQIAKSEREKQLGFRGGSVQSNKDYSGEREKLMKKTEHARKKVLTRSFEDSQIPSLCSIVSQHYNIYGYVESDYFLDTLINRLENLESGKTE